MDLDQPTCESTSRRLILKALAVASTFIALGCAEPTACLKCDHTAQGFSIRRMTPLFTDREIGFRLAWDDTQPANHYVVKVSVNQVDTNIHVDAEQMTAAHELDILTSFALETLELAPDEDFLALDGDIEILRCAAASEDCERAMFRSIPLVTMVRPLAEARVTLVSTDTGTPNFEALDQAFGRLYQCRFPLVTIGNTNAENALPWYVGDFARERENDCIVGIAYADSDERAWDDAGFYCRSLVAGTEATRVLFEELQPLRQYFDRVDGYGYSKGAAAWMHFFYDYAELAGQDLAVRVVGLPKHRGYDTLSDYTPGSIYRDAMRGGFTALTWDDDPVTSLDSCADIGAAVELVTELSDHFYLDLFYPMDDQKRALREAFFK